MPVIVEGPDGAQIEFPDGLSPETMRDAVRKHYGFQAQPVDPVLSDVQARRSSLHVPISGIEDTMAAEDEAAARRTAMDYKTQQAAIDSARTPSQRLFDAATFSASAPIRMATKGDYGLGDVLGSEGLRGRERDFARNNAAVLEMAAAAGDVMAGVPMLGTMGAAPRSMLGAVSRAAKTPISTTRDTARFLADVPGAYGAEARALGGELSAVMSDTSGALGKRTMPAAVAAPPATATAAAPVRPSFSDDDALAAAARLGIEMPQAVGGGRIARSVAGPLSAIPYAGAPIERAYQKGLAGLGTRLDDTVAGTGTPGAAVAGGDVKAGVLDWIKRGSADLLSDEYAVLGKRIKPETKVELNSTRAAVQSLQGRAAESTSTTASPAIRIVEEAVTRPGGLTFNGLKELRTDIGARLEAASVVPEAGTSMPALKQLYGALTEDMHTLAKKHRAGKMLGEINARAADIAATRDELQKIVGRQGDVAAEGVVAKVASLASTKGTANISRLGLLKKHVPAAAWDNLSAEFMNRLGRNPKDGGFSAARYTTDYGKYSDAAKSLLFGPAKQTLDDLVLVARQYEALESKFNRSNTGSVNALMEYILKPGATAAAIGGAIAAPGAALVAGVGGGSGMMIGRSIAHQLAKPAIAGAATKLFKAHVERQRAILERNVGTAATARDAVAAASSEYAHARSSETGESEAGILRRLRRIMDVRKYIEDMK
jgi:hypothetical protein